MCPTHGAPWSQPGPRALLSFPEPLQSWLPPQADSRRTLLLRPPRAGRRHSRPPRALGPAGPRASPGNSAGCCFFFFFFPSPSKLHSMIQRNVFCFPLPGLAKLTL